MNAFFFIALFAFFPLALAAKEDWDTGYVKDKYAILISLGAVAVFVISPELWWANLNLTGLAIWFIVLGIVFYNKRKAEKKLGKKFENKLMGIGDIYLGIALTLLLGMWVNFLYFAMSVGLFVFLLTKIFKKPEILTRIFNEKTRLVPFYLIGLIALLFVLFLR